MHKLDGIPDLYSGEVRTRVFQGEPFPWQTGDSFWDGFKVTVELHMVPVNRMETIFYIHAATLSQVNRLGELIEQASQEFYGQHGHDAGA